MHGHVLMIRGDEMLMTLLGVTSHCYGQGTTPKTIKYQVFKKNEISTRMDKVDHLDFQ